MLENRPRFRATLVVASLSSAKTGKGPHRRQLHGREMKMWAIWRGLSGPTVQLSLWFRTGFLAETALSLRLWSLADAVTATIPEIKAL